jgi:hypothetical protein
MTMIGLLIKPITIILTMKVCVCVCEQMILTHCSLTHTRTHFCLQEFSSRGGDIKSALSGEEVPYTQVGGPDAQQQHSQ